MQTHMVEPKRHYITDFWVSPHNVPDPGYIGESELLRIGSLNLIFDDAHGAKL